MMIADLALDALNSGSKENRKSEWQKVLDSELHEELHLLQIEFMPRNLFSEGSDERAYLVGTEHKGVSSRISDGKWFPLAGYLDGEKKSREISTPPDLLLDEFEILLGRVDKYAPDFYQDWLDGFKLKRQHHKETGTVGKNSLPQIISDAIIVEDGEFTFFALLWVFRYAKKKGFDLTSWLHGTTKVLPLDFKPNLQNEPNEVEASWWAEISSKDFLLTLGLIRADEGIGGFKTTPRWKSFIDWLDRQSQYVRAIQQTIGEEKDGYEVDKSLRFPDVVSSIVNQAESFTQIFIPSPKNNTNLTTTSNHAIIKPDRLTVEELRKCLKHYLRVLPIKNTTALNEGDKSDEAAPDASIERLKWLYALVGFFLSPTLVDFIEVQNTVIRKESNGVAISQDGFIEKAFSQYLKGQNSLLEYLLTDPDSPHSSIDLSKRKGDHDALLNRLPRAGYLPLEILLRRRIPTPMQLLIQPMGFYTNPDGETTPSSLTFANINMSLPEGVPVAFRMPTGGSEQENGELDETAKWLQPYHTLMSRLNHDFTTEQLWEQKEESTILANADQFGHEIPYVIRALREVWSVPLTDYFDLPEINELPTSPTALGRLYRRDYAWFRELILTEGIQNETVNEYLATCGKRPLAQDGQVSLSSYLDKYQGAVSTKVHDLLFHNFCDTISIVPVTRMCSFGLDFLTTWSTPHKLGDFLPGSPKTLVELLNSAWLFVFHAMLAHVSRKISSTPKTLLLIRRKLAAMERLHPEIEIEMNSASSSDLCHISFDPQNPNFSFTTGFTQLLLTLFREHLEHAEILSAPKVLLLSCEGGGFIFEQRSKIRQTTTLDDENRYPEILERIKSKIQTEQIPPEVLPLKEAYDLYVNAQLAGQQAMNLKSRSLGLKVVKKLIKKADPQGQLLHRDTNKLSHEHQYLTKIKFYNKK